MNTIKKTANRRKGFTLVELIVVIAIILVIAALAAAFAPRVSDSQNLTRGVDSLEQWLLTAKMRAKRDQLATGIRFIQMPGDAAGTFSEFQYIQQPDPLSGAPNGPTLQSAGSGIVNFSNVDFSLGGTPSQNQWLVQVGDYLEVRDSGVYLIAGVPLPAPGQPANTLQLSGSLYANALSITTPTTNYRILRQARILIGEAPMNLPNNFAVDTTAVPPTIIPGNSIPPQPLGTQLIRWSNVQPTPSGNVEILFSPSGAVIGANAGSGKVLLTVYDTTMNPFDINRIGIIAVQSRTGFIGAYSSAPGAGTAGYDPFAFTASGRESGL